MTRAAIRTGLGLVVAGAAIMAAHAAPAEQLTVQQVLERHGLAGPFSYNCGSLPSKANIYHVYRIIDAGHAQLDNMDGPGSKLNAISIDKAKELTPNTIRVSGVTVQAADPKFQGVRFTLVLRVEHERIRTIEQSTEKGDIIVSDGRIKANGLPALWLAKCAPGVPRTWLGINMQSVSAEAAGRMGLKRVAGMIVNQVFPNSPAENAGLHPGDIITLLDGSSMTDITDFVTRTAVMQPGTKIKLRVVRKSNAMTVTVELGNRPPEAQLGTPVEQVFKRHDLLGVFAFNCASEPSAINNRQVNRVIDPNHVQVDTMDSRTTIQATVIVDRAEEVWPSDLLMYFSLGATTQRGRMLVKLNGNRMRIAELIADGGGVLVTGGRTKKDGKETPWIGKCQ